MTGPLDPDAVAEVIVRADTSRVEPDIEKGVRKAAKNADDDLDDIGKDMGKTVSKGMEKRLESAGPDLARAVEGGLAREKVRVKTVVELDRDRNVVRTWVTTIERDLADGVREAASAGGFNKVGDALKDAVGAGFNVSGRSPLIALLIPVVGIIAELVLAAIQAAGAVSALLTIIPSLIGGVILQVGILYLAFNGLGEAIGNAFAAKNPDELKKALEGLMPPAQEFVKTLLPLKELFDKLSMIAQNNFFQAFGNSLTVIQKALSPTLVAAAGSMSDALGELGRTLVTFFADPVFVRFFNDLIASTDKWVRGFGPAISTFLVGLANLGHAVTPFLDWFGTKFNEMITGFGQWLSDLSTDQGFLDWLDRVKVTLGLVGRVIKETGRLIFTLVNQLDKAGGDQILKDLADQLEHLSDFFASDIGQKSLEGLVHLVRVLAFAFVFLVLGISALLALFELVLEFVRHGLIPWLGDFFGKMLPKAIGSALDAVGSFFSAIGDWIKTFFTEVLPKALSDFGMLVTAFLGYLRNAISDFAGTLLSQLFETVGNVIGMIGEAFSNFTGWVFSLPGLILNAIGEFGGLLYNAGRNLIQGLINGILSMLGPVGSAMATIAGKIGGFIPQSPAKEGPLSGAGDPMLGGMKISERLAAGIEMGAPAVASASNNMASNVMVGMGAVQMNFYGPTPTASQASAIGGAAGNSLADTLAQRNTRLSVRTMGAAA